MYFRIATAYLDTCIIGEIISEKTSPKRKSVEKIIEFADRKLLKIYTSKYLKDELEESPPKIKKLLIEILSEIPHKELKDTEEIRYLAKRYINEIQLTHMDALHVSTTVINNIDAFLSFNRRTIINTEKISKVKKLNDTIGYKTPIMISPIDLIQKVREGKNSLLLEVI